MVDILFSKGICIPTNLIPINNDCGLDIWASNVIENWITKTLRASVFTLIISESNKSCALLLVIRKNLPIVKFASGYPYSTIYGDVKIFWKNITLVKKCLKKNGISRVELALTEKQFSHVYTTKAEKYISKKYIDKLKAGRHIVKFSNYKNADDLFMSMNGKVRWSVRKGMKNGIEIKKIDVSNLNDAQNLYKETMKDISAPSNYNIDRFKIIIQELAPNSMGGVYVAFLNGSPISMAAVIDSKDIRHLIQIATPKKYRSTRVSDYFVWYLIEDSIKINKKRFDFMASSVSDTSLIEYKSKWNCTFEEITHAVIIVNPMRSYLLDIARFCNKEYSKYISARA